MSGVLQVAECQGSDREVDSSCPLLKQLLLPQQRRHEDVLKKFSIYIIIFHLLWSNGI